MDNEDQIVNEMTGVYWKQAETYYNCRNQAILGRQGLGFKTRQDCENFAKEHGLDKLAYSPSTKGYYYLDHQGKLLTKSEWMATYHKVLYYQVQDTEKLDFKTWLPDNLEARMNCYIIGEKSDGMHDPLYERNYRIPYGYMNPETKCYNIAHPLPYFAEETGEDVSFIYTLLENIAGENYLYLLSWLRQKLIYPTKKTEVMPVFIGNQGTGKSAFADAICTALFGEENVIVTPTFDASRRFNSDQSDKLIVSIEEKDRGDRYNMTGLLKSLITGRTVRKENKGIDPYYQSSHTEYIITSNDAVPVKFDSLDQRRFMVMHTNSDFYRNKGGDETEAQLLADEVFTKIYGVNKHGKKVGQELKNNKKAVKQFTWELWKRGDLPDCKDFVRTEEYKQQFTVPRTNEAVAIESIIKGLCPFIRASITQHKIVKEVDGLSLDAFVYGSDMGVATSGFTFVAGIRGNPDRVGVCEPHIFRDIYGKPYSHAVVRTVLHDSEQWLKEEYGLEILPSDKPPNNGGFTGITDVRMRLAPAVWFALTTLIPLPKKEKVVEAKVVEAKVVEAKVVEEPKAEETVKTFQRFNATYQPDDNGCFEVLNELDETGVRSSIHTLTMNRFLLEADDAPLHIMQQEDIYKETHTAPYKAEELYKLRLQTQYNEAERLFREGVVQRVVYSGAKSYHLIVEVEDSPKTKEERNWLDAYLKSTLSKKVNYDMSTSDSARLTRAPVRMKRIVNDVEGEQCLKMYNPKNIYKKDWRPIYLAWVRSRKGAIKPIMPSKQIYKDAANALLTATFWTDDAWDGRRNELFFPAYRLVLMMGYTVEQVWEAFHEDMKSYKKPDEIKYWLDREHCSLIKTINDEVKGK